MSDLQFEPVPIRFEPNHGRSDELSVLLQKYDSFYGSNDSYPEEIEKIKWNFGAENNQPLKSGYRYSDYLNYSNRKYCHFRLIEVSVSSYANNYSKARHFYVSLSCYPIEITNDGETFSSPSNHPNSSIHHKICVPVSKRLLSEEKDYDEGDYTNRIETREDVVNVIITFFKKFIKPERFFIKFDDQTCIYIGRTGLCKLIDNLSYDFPIRTIDSIYDNRDPEIIY